jgi:hypothetical protein
MSLSRVGAWALCSAEAAVWLPDVLVTISSANVFHSPHEEHFPSHFGDSNPQFRQKNTVLARLIFI